MRSPLLNKRFLFSWLILASACQAPMAASPTPRPPGLSLQAVPSLTPRPSPIASTATATLPPAPRFFTDEFDGQPAYWTFLSSPAAANSPLAEVRAGLLQLNLDLPNETALGLYGEQTYADVRLNAQVEFGPDGAGAAGLVCRYDRGAGWYEFNIYADQTYTLLFGEWLQDGVIRYTPLVISESEKISPAANEIGLECAGDVLTPFVNGVQLRRRQEKQHVLGEGQVGASVASFEEYPLVISYDWVAVGPASP